MCSETKIRHSAAVVRFPPKNFFGDVRAFIFYIGPKNSLPISGETFQMPRKIKFNKKAL